MSKEQQKQQDVGLDFETLVASSEQFARTRQELVVAAKLSLTGITNLVVNYENSSLVDTFLESCYKPHELYNESYNIDAVELQRGMAGQGCALEYLDQLIFGTFQREPATDLGPGQIMTDPRTGERLRNPDGFVNRKENTRGRPRDCVLILRNIDYCNDFCSQTPGVIDPKAVALFDKFRHPKIKWGACLILVTNERLQLPFKVRTVKLEPVDALEANHIIDATVDLFVRHKIKVSFSTSQRQQMVRKLCGLIYTEASDAFNEALSKSRVKKEDGDKTQEIDSMKVLRKLREKINSNFMEDAVGLTHLNPKPWEDYICPESSNFTFDVQKIVRDFEEIKSLREMQEKAIRTGKNDDHIVQTITAIRTRMPHVIVLYGKGGVGKSAFPIHFAGLLDFDVWDFNVTATHSKWIGEGPERMREGLEKISKASHLVVRIDEYDRAMGATSASGHGMHEAHKQVESEFMNWLQNEQEENSFVKNDIFVIMTTNHKENITGPLLRSGRADLVIDINDFDEKSMMETFVSAPRRMKNRGVTVVGFGSYDALLKEIEALDLQKLASIASRKNFTVRDVDTLIMEMAAHRYYKRRGKGELTWDTDTFAKILERSVGSGKSDDTCELVLGDRYLIENEDEEPQSEFPFEEIGDQPDITKFKDTPFFK